MHVEPRQACSRRSHDPGRRGPQRIVTRGPFARSLYVILFRNHVLILIHWAQTSTSRLLFHIVCVRMPLVIVYDN
jgi:hypothetical protein